MTENEENNFIPLPSTRKQNRPGKAIKDLKAKLKKKRSRIKRRNELQWQDKKEVEKLATVERVLEGKQTIVDSTLVEEFNVIKEEKQIIWEATPLQLEFLAADEDEVFFSGGRGSGKSDALLFDALRDCHNPNFRGLVLRRTMPELRDLIGRAQTYYPKVYPGVRWKEQEKLFVFPSGAKIEFGYCDSIDDLLRYQGQQYTWLGIDELPQYATADIIDKLKASLRTTDRTLKIYVRATGNPGGPGRNWVKERWVDQGLPNTLIKVPVTVGNKEYTITRRWFHSTVFDNKHLMENNPHYLASLGSLEGVQRAQWLEGSWDSADGLAFPDFKRVIHTVEPFQIPANWYKFRACDWGYATLAVCLWFAVDFDGNYYIYREHTATRTDPDVFAREVLRLEEKERVKYGVLDSSCWSSRGESGPTIAEIMMKEGCSWRPSDRSPGSRISGKMLMHSLLTKNPTTERPKIKIFTTCKELIAELSTLQLDDLNPEDIDRNGWDHAWDACKYGIASRPISFGTFDNIFGSRINSKPIVVDPLFGY